MKRKLSNEEIDKRLIRLRNLERLRGNDKELILKLKEKNAELGLENKEDKATIETLLLRIEELERIVFGSGGGGSGKSRVEKAKKRKARKKERQRKKSSYRRAIPQEVTEEKVFHLPNCPDCGEELQKKMMREQYIEDIALSLIDEGQSKKVTKELVEKGYCRQCKKWKSGKKLQTQDVSFGNNVGTLIVFCTYILNLSYAQVQGLLNGIYNFQISDGEIANILEKGKNQLVPEYEKLKEKIRGNPGNHYDETGWRQGKEKSYTWVQTGNVGEEAIFSVGRSRGKGVAEELKGDCAAIGISDCYEAYKNLFEVHQICWAHLQRNAKDLSDSPSLDEAKKKRCVRMYAEIAKVYKRLREFHQSKFDERKGKGLMKQLLKSVDNFTELQADDPQKLQNLLRRIQNYRHALFTCLEHPGISPDNNKAERKLRHLVLKRKNSFGTKTEKGSHAFSINASVALSYWWTNQKKWFHNLHALLNP